MISWLLDASSHLYNRVCPFVGSSVGRSVRRLVTLSSKTGKSMILIANNNVSCNHIIIQSFHHHEDASLALWALLVRNRGRSSVCLFVFSSVYPSIRLTITCVHNPRCLTVRQSTCLTICLSVSPFPCHPLFHLYIS